MERSLSTLSRPMASFTADNNKIHTCKTQDRFQVPKENPNWHWSHRCEILSHYVSNILTSSCVLNTTSTANLDTSDELIYFYSCGLQSFSLEEYLYHVMYESSCSESVYLLALMYMMRAQKKHKLLQISTENVHRLYLTCVTIAAKYLEHSVLSNADMASIGGLQDVKELNKLERLLLKTLDYDLKCSTFHYKVLCHVIMGVRVEDEARILV